MRYIFSLVREARLHLNGEKSVIPERLELMDIIEDFVNSGSYTKCKQFKKLLEVRNEAIVKQAEHLGLKETNVRRIRSELTADALSVLGDNTIDIVMHGSDDNVRRCLQEVKYNVLTKSTLDLFSHEFLTKVRDINIDDTTTFSVTDCVPELALLYWLSNERLIDLLSNVDLERLKYLLNCIDGKSGTPQDKVKILRIILNDDLFKNLKPEMREKFNFPPKRD